MSVLLLRLSGPMQAWGTQSRFSIRDTGLEPSKSAVLGLLCAALGKPRDESARPDLPSLTELSQLKMAVRIDRPGIMSSDYHTAKDVAKAGGGIKDCELSQRFYLADAEFLVSLQGPAALLGKLDLALSDPVWPLFLGRKSFPPSMPIRVQDGLIDTDDALAALKSQPFFKRPQDKPSLCIQVRIMQEAPAGQGEARNDVPLSFVSPSRGFRIRHVADVEMWNVPLELIKDFPHVPLKTNTRLGA